ncbi:MAG: hypothetical protein U0793_06510 [Gemmataceae bacterium]
MASVRKRPPLFRALGRHEPPLRIEVDGRAFERVEILKHDSWAATAVYRNDERTIVCKFNRTEHVFGVPMDWLGRWLADRERRALTRLSGLPGIPPVCGPIYADGRRLVNAVAHDYIEGHPLAKNEQVSATFFPALRRTLGAMHRRGIAYVDLHKRENIIVGADGRPYFIDFQIHFGLDARFSGPVSRAAFRLLCRSDDYHVDKHVRNSGGEATPPPTLPWWIRAHRFVAKPLRQLRRRLLVLFGIRRAEGRAETEAFAEDAVRREQARAA